MKTEKELNKDILKIIATIREKFPELLKYVVEMPVKISSPVGEEINIKELNDYCNSLETIIKKYAVSQDK